MRLPTYCVPSSSTYSFAHPRGCWRSPSSSHRTACGLWDLVARRSRSTLRRIVALSLSTIIFFPVADMGGKKSAKASASRHAEEACPEPFRQQLKDKKFRGFLCGVEASSLDACALAIIPDNEKDKPAKLLLSAYLGCREEHVRCRHLDEFHFYFVDNSKLQSPVPNKLACQIAFASGDKFFALGKLAVVTAKERSEKLPRMGLAAFEELERKLEKLDATGFDAWFAEQCQKLDARNDTGSFVYVPMWREPGRAQELDAQCEGWAEISRRCQELFEDWGAKKKDLTEPESEDEEEHEEDSLGDEIFDAFTLQEQRERERNVDVKTGASGAKMWTAFKARGLSLVYIRGSDAINFVLVERSSQTNKQQRGGINVAVARYIYHKFGASALESLLTKIRGDVIIFKAKQYHSEGSCKVAPRLGSRYLKLLSIKACMILAWCVCVCSLQTQRTHVLRAHTWRA